MDKDIAPRFDYQILMRILRLAKPYKKVFILAGILAIVLAPVASLRPYLINRMVDDHILQFDLNGLLVMTGILFGLLLLEVIMRYGFIYSTNLLGQSVIKDLRTIIFKHVISLKLKYFDRTPIGTLTTRTINDIESINTVFSQGVITIVADILGLIAVLIVMFFSSWQLTVICLTTMPLMILATYVFKEKVKSAFQKVRTQIARMNAFLQERISGMRIVQIFNSEERELEKFKKINREYTQANLDSILYYAVFFPVVDIIAAASLGLMVWWGARGVIAEEITFGALVAFPIYLNMLFRPLRFIADKFNTLQMGLVAAERVFRVIDSTEQIENTGTIKPERLQGKIEFRNVSFAYDNINYVLEDINFNIAPGATLAIVGSTGSGKSTIINILNRFYEIQKGQILIDDIDIGTFELNTLRARNSIVLQDVFLFAGTIVENITLRDENISYEKVRTSAKMIGAHEFIERMPNGYNFHVNERGSNLSMGQRQIISFIRALVFDPDILILDEATSSIDTETEAIIQYAIEKLIDKRTSIIIAHRLSTIRHANHIAVMSKGKIVEYGTHEALLAIENGHYRKLYEMQFAEVSID
ncbi:MAG: ABC transporter ATP-binding protein/permease [Saprospiraceae bacterium]|nr:ABC transporter ATP-binding protein/permease [Saprospiraceae bacterium]